MVTTVGGRWELRAVALLKAGWWDMHLASLLAHLFGPFGILRAVYIYIFIRV